MSDINKPSLRIDWFDGTLIEDTRPSSDTNPFADEEQPEPQQSRPQIIEKKPIGFKRLQDISAMRPPALTLEVSHRPGFWNLLDIELKGDFIVLIVKVLANIYKSLEPGEKSRIASQLKSKLEKAMFLNTLKEYVAGLPAVRISEKKINFQLWNDVELFYIDLIALCEGIVNFGSHSIDFMKEIFDLLEISDTSAVGVIEEHKETISSDFFSRIDEVKLTLSKMISEDPNEKSISLNEETVTDPYSYKNLHLFPRREDLFCESKFQIQPNIIDGAYPSVEHYLDLQFKLLREDYFGPLREGINKYMNNPSKRRHENIRVFTKVRILRTFVSNNKVGHLVDIAWSERINHGIVDNKKLAHNKQLMFGSLLLFTCDNFETILCATVLDSSVNLLMEGYVAVSFQSPVSKTAFTEPYLMVESEVFFEPYHRVLKVLQISRMEDFPMKRYIVDVQPETKPPSYLTSETVYTVQESTSSKPEEICFPVLDVEQWPPANILGLDRSQFEAYKFALTREFAVIQGPPGTGKTFIGVKIASTILKNLSLEGTPMLIICYTNHALDQFLEGILSVTKNIIRLGSQSKSKVLEPYTLNNLRMKMKSKYSYLYANKRSQLEKIFKDMMDLQSEIEKCEKEILSYKTIKNYLKIDDQLYELKIGSKDDPVLEWLFGDKEENIELVELEDWEKQLDELSVDDYIDTCFSEKWALQEIDSMKNSLRYVQDVTDDENVVENMTDKFEEQIDKLWQRLRSFRIKRALLPSTNIEVPKVENLYKLSSEQRWAVYNNAVAAIKDKLLIKMDDLLDQHNTCSDELNEVATLIDGEVMKTVRVVGVTTTTAARRHDLMRKLLSPIVIVEEAAEVLEGHIVASLTNHCQHLILIGDHKQLRPTAAHYKLAKDYNLEISLFERMIRNGVHARTLDIQRRMRPNCAQLLVPEIYGKLDSHELVFKYPDVRGMRDNLFFVTHDVFEDSEGLEDSWSHKHTLEAKWCVALANYLREMKYKIEEITILSTYTGQVSLIKELSKNYKLLRDVKVTPVDNYQGEENRIVILSLVRSNRDGKIGFLAAVNRVCVALSRAKEGFYIFGNMGVLKSASNIWRAINEKLLARNAIGTQLTVRCDTHKENVLKEFGESTESEKPTKEEYAVAKWLKANVPTKKTKFLNHHVEYFTGTKAVDALLTSKWATGKNPIFTTRHDVTTYLHQMLLHKLFHRAKKVPVSEQELKGKKKKDKEDKSSKRANEEKDGDKSQASACEGKDTKEKEKEKKKRKIRLEMHLDQLFLDTADAYVWLYNPMPWYYWLFGVLVVLGTICVCMFPLWPATFRKGVYYLSVAAAAFLVLIIALAALRLVVFCAVWLLTLSRHHLWLLPNLTEDVGFFASFWPLYKYEYRGPGSESEKAAKNKKKRKKDKHSDDEEPRAEPAPVREKDDEKDEHQEEAKEESPLLPSSEKHSESESENSQRSSTDRDFEMVEPEMVETDLDPDPKVTT